MGRRGPAPKPTELKLVHGERKDRINTDQPQFSGQPTCPSHLPAEGKKVWKEVVAELARFDLITSCDGPSLEAYCMAVVAHRKAARDITKRGILIEGDKKAKVRNPSLIVLAQAADDIRAFAREFGLTPSARSGLRVGGQPDAKSAARFRS